MAIANPIASGGVGKVSTVEVKTDMYRGDGKFTDWLHTDMVYNALINAAGAMETRLQESLENYQEHPDVQANLQQLQYDLQSWNLALTTMTNINKSMYDAMNSIVSNLR